MAAETVTWIDPINGASHVLDGSSSANPLCYFRQGFNMPLIAQLDQRTPLQPGTSVRSTDFLPRPVVIGLNISGNGNETTLRSQIRTMTSVWFPPGKPGVLRNTAVDGVQRDLFCWYVDGMPLDETYPTRKPGSVVAPVQLLGADPFWYDVAPTAILFNSLTSQNALLSTTFLPLTLSGNAPYWISDSITNSGDFETWAVFQVHGPANTLVLTNLTTGKAIKLTANGGVSLAANEILTIDMLNATITKQDGSNQISLLSSDSMFWSLVPGLNDLAINATNVTGSAGTSNVLITYKQRWNAP